MGKAVRDDHYFGAVANNSRFGLTILYIETQTLVTVNSFVSLAKHLYELLTCNLITYAAERADHWVCFWAHRFPSLTSRGFNATAFILFTPAHCGLPYVSKVSRSQRSFRSRCDFFCEELKICRGVTGTGRPVPGPGSPACGGRPRGRGAARDGPGRASCSAPVPGAGGPCGVWTRLMGRSIVEGTRLLFKTRLGGVLPGTCPSTGGREYLPPPGAGGPGGPKKIGSKKRRGGQCHSGMRGGDPE